VSLERLLISDGVGLAGAEEVHTLLLLAVCLVVLLALRAVQAGRDLGTNADAVSDLDRGHLGPDLDCGSHDLCTTRLSAISPFFGMDVGE
jgi:hypothetical protein